MGMNPIASFQLEVLIPGLLTHVKKQPFGTSDTCVFELTTQSSAELRKRFVVAYRLGVLKAVERLK